MGGGGMRMGNMRPGSMDNRKPPGGMMGDLGGFSEGLGGLPGVPPGGSRFSGRVQPSEATSYNFPSYYYHNYLSLCRSSGLCNAMHTKTQH